MGGDLEEHLKNELLFLEKLYHPNIVTIFELLHDDE
jgi:serine/threonine protein kinase